LLGIICRISQDTGQQQVCNAEKNKFFIKWQICSSTQNIMVHLVTRQNDTFKY